MAQHTHDHDRQNHDHHGHSGHDHDGHDHAHEAASPEFRITLSPAQLQTLGRLTLTWSQIDFLIVNIASALEKVDPGKIAATLYALPMAERIAHLQGLIAKLPTPIARDEASRVCEAMAAAVPHRDHALLGLWGDFIDYDAGAAVPGAFHGLAGRHPLRAAELDRMANDAATLSRRLASVLGMLVHTFASGSPRRFFFSDRAPPAGKLPDWHP